MQKKPSGGAADSIGGNSDLLAEILQHLPPKTLTSFKLVSKHFHSLITSPPFSLRHFRLHSLPPSPPSGFYFYNPLTASPKSASFSLSPSPSNSKTSNLDPLPSLSYLYTIAERTGSSLRILNSANGVLLCRFSFKSRLCIHVVTNPVNKGIHVLPFLSNSFEPDSCEVILCYHMVFDLAVSEYIRVFCIKNVKHQLVDDDCFRAGPCVVYVYSFETEKWALIYDFELSLSNVSVRGVYWDGGIHWIGVESSLHYDIKANKVTTRVMPPRPRGGEDWHKIRYFGESGGHLHLIQVRSLKVVKFNILELDKEKGTWFVKYRVHLRPIMQIFPELMKVNGFGDIKKHTFSILGVVREEIDDDSALVMAIPGKVIAFNLKHKEVKQLCELPGEISENFRFIPVSSFQYAESLFPVR